MINYLKQEILEENRDPWERKAQSKEGKKEYTRIGGNKPEKKMASPYSTKFATDPYASQHGESLGSSSLGLNAEEVGVKPQTSNQESQPTPTKTTPQTKNKRRSKNDNEGRSFICGCGKSYLSYPALYTHIKTKHGGKNPEGTNAPHLNNGRGRGRPKKVTDAVQDTSRENEMRRTLTMRSTTQEKDFVQQLDGYGGPCNPLEGFPMVVDEDNNHHIHPVSAKIEHMLKTKHEGGKAIDLKCDDLFAIFLEYNSHIMKPTFYRSMVIYICFLREFLNNSGWPLMLRKQKIKTIPGPEMEFCAEHNTEFLPELANDFVTEFMPKECPYMDVDLAVNLTKKFCDWLYNQGHTNVKLDAKTKPKSQPTK